MRYPAGCGSGTVRGTDLYSDDSSVCTAAIHAGAIPAGGGAFILTIAEGAESFEPSTRNGITTQRWDAWPRGFRVAAR